MSKWDEKHRLILTVPGPCMCGMKFPNLLRPKVSGNITIENDEVIWTCCNCRRTRKPEILHMVECNTRRIFFLRETRDAIIQYIYKLEHVAPSYKFEETCGWKEDKVFQDECGKCGDIALVSKYTLRNALPNIGSDPVRSIQEFKEIRWCPICQRSEIRQITDIVDARQFP